MTMTTTETTTDSSLGLDRWRPLLGAAIALLLLATGCSSDDSTASTAEPVGASTTVTTTAQTALPRPSELLAAALEQYRSGYEFVATTAVNDQEAVVQTGRWLDEASQLVVRSGDGEVEYIVTTDGQWARLPDGDWELIDGAPDTTFPLAPMATPQSVELLASDGGVTTLVATYAAEAMGLEGELVEVVLDFQNGVLVGMSFTADVGGNVTESVTSLKPLTDTTPITPPAE